jgi:mono/diheme cytochrome c family protein
MALLIGLSLVLFPVSSQGQDQDQDLAGSKALFEQRCSECHPLEKPLAYRADREEWGKIVNKMRWKSFFKISKEEVEIIADYMSRIRGPEQP